MPERKYVHTFADLCDRLSIVLLKQIRIPENREAYKRERHLIESDLDDMLPGLGDGICGKILGGADITAILMIMLSNVVIWDNEAEARKGGRSKNKLLRFTHSINGCRNTAKNILSGDDRKDYKIDCLAADLPEEFGNWKIWE